MRVSHQLLTGFFIGVFVLPIGAMNPNQAELDLALVRTAMFAQDKNSLTQVDTLIEQGANPLADVPTSHGPINGYIAALCNKNIQYAPRILRVLFNKKRQGAPPELLAGILNSSMDMLLNAGMVTRARTSWVTLFKHLIQTEAPIDPVERAAYVNQEDSYGNTMLQRLARNYESKPLVYKPLIELLLTHNADPKIASLLNVSAWDYPIVQEVYWSQHPEIIETRNLLYAGVVKYGMPHEIGQRILSVYRGCLVRANPTSLLPIQMRNRLQAGVSFEKTLALHKPMEIKEPAAKRRKIRP